MYNVILHIILGTYTQKTFTYLFYNNKLIITIALFNYYVIEFSVYV